MTVRRDRFDEGPPTVDEFDQHDDVVDLRTYALILWRRKWTVVVTTLLVTAIAVGLTFTQTPMYDAQAELAIEPLRRSEDTSLTDLILGSATIETERRVMTSSPVAQRVIDTLNLETSVKDLVEQVTVNTVRDTRVVTVLVSDESPDRAVAIANTFVAEYLNLRRAEALDRLSAARDSLAEKSQALQSELDSINRDLSSARDRGDTAEVDSLEAQRDSVLTQLAQVTAQQLTADAESDLVRGGGTVLRNAELPESPSSPKKARTGVLAIVLGGMLGVGLAFGKEFLDDGVHSEDVLVRVTGGAPVFGRIPKWDQEHHRAVAMVDPGDHAVEAYRELRANVRFVMGRGARDTDWEGRRRARTATAERRVVGKSVLITSSIAGEGKSSTAANLAVVAAQGGAKIALVDADMRRPQVDNIFGIGASAGLSDLLAEGGKVTDRLVSVGLPNLHILPAGPLPPNPAELLASREMADLLTELESTHDLVVIDSPPVLAVADALEVAQLTSATLLVSSADKSSQRAIRRSIERLGHIGVMISGSVLNRLDKNAHGSYYGYYQPYAEATKAVATAPATRTPTARKTEDTAPHSAGQAARASNAAATRPTEPSPTQATSPAARPVPSAPIPTQPAPPASPLPPTATPRPDAPASPPTPAYVPESTPRPGSEEIDVTGRLPRVESQPTPPPSTPPQPPTPAQRPYGTLWRDDTKS